MTQTMLGMMSKISFLSIDVSPKINSHFQKTNYTLTFNGNTMLYYDQSVRKSEDAQCDEPNFNQQVIPILNKYLNDVGETVALIDNTWRVLKYSFGGHFIEHKDRVREKQGYVHFGSQILLPPKQICDYEGGILQIKEKNQTYKIKPVQRLWTHIVIPLGIAHSVCQVQGTRISYVKQIYLHKRENIKYQVPVSCLDPFGRIDIVDVMQSNMENSGSPKPKPNPIPPRPQPKD